MVNSTTWPTRRFAGLAVGAATLLPTVTGFVAAGPASADPCPDVQLIFDRGTFEAPGVGSIGQDFADAVRRSADAPTRSPST